MGTHKEGGATSFWSYTLNLPLSSNALISWKFCYLLHKVLREGHRNARLNLNIASAWSRTLYFLFDMCVCFPPSDVQVVQDSHRHCHTVKDMGHLWVSSSDGRSIDGIITMQ